jgi:F-type H+-transporting ATPase subunit epsilon
MTVSSPSEGPIAYEIVTPRGVIAAGHCDRLVAPAIDGEVAFLRLRAPYLALLGVGVVRIVDGQETRRAFVADGFVEILDDRVIVLAETGEMAEMIDRERAEAAHRRAKQRLMGIRADLDEARARKALRRAEAREKAAS